MGLASRFNSGAGQQGTSPQQQSQYQPGGPSQPQTPTQFPPIQQSWQGSPQQYQQPQQGYQQPPYGYQQQPGYQQSVYPQQNAYQQGYQPSSQPSSQPWQQSQTSSPSQGYQQQQSQQQAGSPGGLNDQGVQTVLHNQLNNIIRVNRLEAFYPPQRLQQVKDHVAKVDFR